MNRLQSLSIQFHKDGWGNRCTPRKISDCINIQVKRTDGTTYQNLLVLPKRMDVVEELGMVIQALFDVQSSTKEFNKHLKACE